MFGKVYMCEGQVHGDQYPGNKDTIHWRHRVQRPQAGPDLNASLTMTFMVGEGLTSSLLKLVAASTRKSRTVCRFLRGKGGLTHKTAGSVDLWSKLCVYSLCLLTSGMIFFSFSGFKHTICQLCCVWNARSELKSSKKSKKKCLC